MFKRFTLHLALIFLFAFTQIGLATHEISHFEEFAKHSKQDKNSQNEQCEQCISFAKVANGLSAPAFVLPTVNTHFTALSSYHFNNQSSLNTPYAARAPPLNHII